MLINIRDIPQGGKNLELKLCQEKLNQRTNQARNQGNKKAVLPPEYLFTKNVTSEVFITLEVKTVIIKGSFKANFQTPCSRCAEDLETELSKKIEMVLKPTQEKDEDKSEDVGFGFYDGEEFDVAEIVEEQLMLSLPYAVSCSKNELESCEKAMKNLQYLKNQDVKDDDTNPFSVLKELKIN